MNNKSMVKKAKWTLLIVIYSLFVGCSGSKNDFEASGTFEAEGTIISAEATGVIRQFDVEEGQELTAGQIIGYIDSTQLYLKKRQLESQIRALQGRKPNIAVQLSALQAQLQTAQTERTRLEKLVAGDAATRKQLDDVNAQIEVLKKQMNAQQSSLKISSDGTVLAKIAKVNELTTVGKPLYKIADLQNITFRAFVTSAQLTQLKIGQNVRVFADFGEKKRREYKGTISWISDKSEFTPKNIQTQDERANLVYAVKITVKNDGYLKIGMYGEVNFNQESSGKK